MQEPKVLTPFRIINPKIVFGTCALVFTSMVAGVALFSIDQYQSKRAATVDGNHYFHATDLLDKVREDKARSSQLSPEDLKRVEEAKEELKAITNSPSKGVRYYSLLRLADLYAQEGDLQSAIDAWNKVYNQTDTKSPLHDFAHFMKLNAQMKLLHEHPETFDKSQKEAIRLGYLDIIKENNAWRPLATEGLIASDLHSEDKATRIEAQKKLKQLALGQQNSLDLKRRANLLLPALKADGTTSKAGN